MSPILYQDREMMMGEPNVGTHGAGSDRDEDRRERYYQRDSAGIGGMARFQAPPRPISGKETYKGLGTGINEWTNRFLRQLERAQLANGVCWSEDVKIDVLEDHLEGKTLEYWQMKTEILTNHTLEHALEELKGNYRCTLSDR